jgi:Mg2+ and Co2+ transporter CorA
MSVRALLSSSDGVDKPIELDTFPASAIDDAQLLWVDVQGATEQERALVGQALALDVAALDALDACLVKPDAQVLRDGILLGVRTLASDLSDDPSALQVLVGSKWVLTWHAEPVPFLDEHFHRIQDQREVGRLTAVLFLVEILDWHLDTYFAAAESLECEVDELDEEALRGDGKNVLERLVEMRRRISRVRQLLGQHRDMYAEIARPDFLPEPQPREAEALAAINHRLERATEAVANAREMLIGTFDVHMTRTAQRTNDVMKLLTWVSVTLLPAGVLAGVMGMNFRVGLFDNPDLFWVVVGSMLAMAATILGAARWRRWL